MTAHKLYKNFIQSVPSSYHHSAPYLIMYYSLLSFPVQNAQEKQHEEWGFILPVFKRNCHPSQWGGSEYEVAGHTSGNRNPSPCMVPQTLVWFIFPGLLISRKSIIDILLVCPGSKSSQTNNEDQLSHIIYSTYSELSLPNTFVAIIIVSKLLFISSTNSQRTKGFYFTFTICVDQALWHHFSSFWKFPLNIQNKTV